MYPYLDLLGEMCNILIWLIPRGQHSTFVFHELLKLAGELLKHLCLGQQLLQVALFFLLLALELLEALAHLCQFALQHGGCGAVSSFHELSDHLMGGFQAAFLSSNVLFEFLSSRMSLSVRA